MCSVQATHNDIVSLKDGWRGFVSVFEQLILQVPNVKNLQNLFSYYHIGHRLSAIIQLIIGVDSELEE